jgi:hypothetical protein
MALDEFFTRYALEPRPGFTDYSCDSASTSRTPAIGNGGVPLASRLRRQNIPQPASLMIGRMIRASGADDVASLGS